MAISRMVAGLPLYFPDCGLRPYRFDGRIKMHAFLPDSALTVALLFALLAVEFITGFALQYVKPNRGIQLRAWVLAAAATLIAHWITLPSPPGFRMLGLIA